MYLGFLNTFAHWAAYEGSKIALRTQKSSYTYGFIFEAAKLLAAGIPLGRDPIGLYSKSPFHSLVGHLAAELAGRPVVVLNPDLDFEILELCLADARPELIITNEDLTGKIKLPIIEITIPDNIVQLPYDFSKVSSTSELAGRKKLFTSWGMLFSSGSTGVPKAVEHDHYSIWTEQLAWIFALRLNPDINFVVLRPFYYTGGLVVALATLMAGGTVFMIEPTKGSLDEIYIKDLYQTIEALKIKPDWTFATPYIARKTADIILDDHRVSVGKLLLMGAPISQQQKFELAELLNCEITESWGNSEGLGTIAFDWEWKKRAGTVGRPFLSEKIIIMNEDGNPASIGETGRICGVDDSYFDGYSNRPEATQLAKINGLVASDNLGYLDEDGFLYLRSRMQQTFLIDGHTVYGSEIEGIVKDHFKVCECAVIAENSGSDGDCGKIMICVEIAQSQDSLSLKSIIKEFVAAYFDIQGQWIRALIFKSIPRTGSGKIAYDAIKEIDAQQE